MCRYCVDTETGTADVTHTATAATAAQTQAPTLSGDVTAALNIKLASQHLGKH